MKLRIESFFVFALLTSLSGAALAQTTSSTEKKPLLKQKQKIEQIVKPVPIAKVKRKPNKTPVVKFSIAMLESGRFDPGYFGFSIAEVVDAIEKTTSAKKGEYELTTEYSARRAAALTGKFLADYSLDDTFAFVLAVAKGWESRVGLGYDFNADTSEVRLFVLPKWSSMNGIGESGDQTNRREYKGFDQFNLEWKLDSESAYEGSNAHGAKVRVEKVSYTRLGIVVNRIPFLSFTRGIFYIDPSSTTKFTIERVRAAKELPAMKALFVMRLANPYIAYHFSSVAPTLESPRDISNRHKYLTGDVLGIIFYSGLTGEIFSRLPEDFGKPAPKLETRAEDKTR